MKNRLISSVCICSGILVFNALGADQENDVQFDELSTPVDSVKQTKQFSLSDLFSSLSPSKKQKSTKTKTVSEKQKQDYFAEDLQAFAEDDPWEIQ